MRAALEALPGAGAVRVSRHGPWGNGQYAWDITFREPRGDLPLLRGNAATLQGTSAGVTVVELRAGVAGSLTGPGSRVHVEEVIAGAPTYTGRYATAETGAFFLAMRAPTPGGLRTNYFDNQSLQDAPALSTVESSCRHDWGEGLVSPYACDYVSMRSAWRRVLSSASPQMMARGCSGTTCS